MVAHSNASDPVDVVHWNGVHFKAEGDPPTTEVVCSSSSVFLFRVYIIILFQDSHHVVGRRSFHRPQVGMTGGIVGEYVPDQVGLYYYHISSLNHMD